MSKSRTLLWFAPIVFLLHVAEEAPSLVEWFNRHVQPRMTDEMFVILNTGAAVITLVLVGAAAIRGVTRGMALALLGWLAFLMLANGTLHILASLVFREYVPGTVTAVVFYLPYFALVFRALRRAPGVTTRSAIAASAIGAVPMVTQGIGILVFGRRLFW
jgi:hypothetical protein